MVYENVRKMFRKEGLVFTKNDYSGGYSSSRDVGGGAVDENNIITQHDSLKEAKEWLSKKIKLDEEIKEFNEKCIY